MYSFLISFIKLQLKIKKFNIIYSVTHLKAEYSNKICILTFFFNCKSRRYVLTEKMSCFWIQNLLGNLA